MDSLYESVNLRTTGNSGSNKSQRAVQRVALYLYCLVIVSPCLGNANQNVCLSYPAATHTRLTLTAATPKLSLAK